MSEEEVIEETPKAYAAFMDYCLLGTSRSLEKLRQKLGRNTAYIRVLEQWSSRYQWVKRVTAYDKEQLEDRRHKAQEAVDAMNTEIAEEAKKLRALAVGHLEYIEHMHGKDAVALWKEAVLAQRLALGEATTRTESELSSNPDAPLQIVANFGTPTTDSKDEERQE